VSAQSRSCFGSLSSLIERTSELRVEIMPQTGWVVNALSRWRVQARWATC
jgi:hypothetical protein